ncbi:MAG: HTH domain-containing protein [Bacteroidota bacterium]|nr:HTH domain-containing protein [Bacteroidota bacterium]
MYKATAMTYLEYSDKLERLKQLVEQKQAGTPEQLAKKLNVSERTLYRMIQRLRDHGYPITYNRTRCTYEVKSH